MNIKSRLTLQFLFAVAPVLLLSFILIYVSSYSYRQSSFYDRLNSRAVTLANLYFQYSKLDSGLLRHIDQLAKDHPYGETLCIYNIEGGKLYSNADSNQLAPDSQQISLLKKFRSMEYTVGPYEVKSILFHFAQKDYVIISAGIDKFGLNKLENLRNTLLILFVFIILLVIAVGRLYSSRVMKPIIRVIEEAERISPENLGSRLKGSHSDDEIGRLIKTFNKLLERIEKAFKVQKTFVAGASHEIRNPLTVITSQLEVTLLKERTAEEYRSTITSVLEDIKDLNRLAIQLMDLARATNAGMDILSQRFRMDELLYATKGYFADKYPTYKVHLLLDRLPEDSEQLYFDGNEPLLKIALINLVENACKFSDDQSVTIHFEQGDGAMHITLKDRGKGIAPADLEMIFEPFYRGDNHRTTKGHGVGLALVQQIVKIHKGEILVSSVPGEGTNFQIHFKTS